MPRNKPAGARSRWLLRLVLLFLTVLGAAQAEEFGPLFITAEPTPPGECTHGYSEYRFRVANRSAQKGFTVTIRLSQDNPSGSDLATIERTVKVPAAGEMTVALYQPALSFYSDGAEILVDGAQQFERVGVRTAQLAYYHNKGPLILVSRNVPINDLEKKLGIGSSTGYDPKVPDFVHSESTVDRWTDNWLGYSRYDGLLVYGDDLTQSAPEIRRAIWQYVETGGMLMVLGGTVEPPETWKDQVRREGEVKIVRVGFGEVRLVDPRSLDDIPKAAFDTFVEAARETRSPFTDRRLSPEEVNRKFPVTEGLGLPMRALFALVLLFTVFIGPVNLWFLAKKGRKIWIFWIVPLFSLITAGLIFAYATLAEGWDIKSRSAAFTLLDEGAHQATTLGIGAYYSPLTSGEGLHFRPETEVSSFFESYRYNRDARQREIDWTSDQHLGAGWLAARVPIHLLIRKSESRRERISFTPGSAPSVMNGLGKRISVLRLVDFQGGSWTAGDIPPGGRANLSAGTNSRLGNSRSRSFRSFFQGAWLDEMADVRGRPEDYLVAGSYVAELEESPFLEPALESPTVLEQKAVVLGLMKEGMP